MPKEERRQRMITLMQDAVDDHEKEAGKLIFEELFAVADNIESIALSLDRIANK